MKFRKTKESERDTYKYYAYVKENGKWKKKVVTELKTGDICCNDDGSEAVIEEELIKILHRMDDNEVCNNNKYGRPLRKERLSDFEEHWKDAVYSTYRGVEFRETFTEGLHMLEPLEYRVLTDVLAGYKQREVAEKINRSQATVSRILHKAVKSMAEYLPEE